MVDTREEPQLSKVEAELYDRQIRLWGIESQEKLRAANVLLINIRSLGSEIAKNILLCGINSLTILDDGIVTPEDQSRNFLLTRESIGKKIAEEVVLRAQALNPLVKIEVDTSAPSGKEEKFFGSFTIIIATGVSLDFLLKLDKICIANNVKLIAGDICGLFGYSVADFLKHKYYEDRIIVLPKKRTHDGNFEADSTVQKVEECIEYPELSKVLVLPDMKDGHEFATHTKRRNRLFYLLLCLVEFKNKNNRNPDFNQKQDDIEMLKTIKASIISLYKISYNIFNDTLFDLVFDEVVPICAVLGGVIAQEVIKAVSHKEVPLNNVFLLDPITYEGREETINIVA